MSDSTRFPTLLPYLRTGESRVRLDLVRSAPQPADAGGYQNPFRPLTEGTALSRIFEAAWVTDSGSSIQDVFLVVQRDAYPWSGREAGRLVNPAIEAIWRQTHAFCSEEEPKGLMVLEEQLDGDRRLLPFQSLFYCREKRVFFHPPCPRCGQPLELCRDDTLLTASQLLPYSLSLRRYLHCAFCARQEVPGTFYAFEPGSYDPPCVKDRFALLSGFGRAPASAADSAGFPCGRCDQREECYGVPNAVSSRLFPFAFYPFYGLLFRAMPMNASELLVTLSGGTFADVRESLQRQGELGRLRAIERSGLAERDREAFLFRNDERFFLEVLLLKVCFLAEAVNKLRRGGTVAQNVEGFATLEQLWVSLPEKPGHLPGAWSFGLRIADVFSPRVGSASAALVGFRGTLHSLGLAWFQTLLVNARQDAARVSEALDQLLDKRFSNDAPSAGPPRWDLAGSVFHAENIMWKVDAHYLEASWSGFWEETLTLGWTLFVASHTNTRDWSWADFEWQIEALRERLLEALFYAREKTTAREPVHGESPTEESRAIHAILTQIQTVWRNRAEMEQTARAAAEPAASPTRPPLTEEDTLPLGIQWEEEARELAETVILTSGAARKPDEEEPRPMEATPTPDEVLPETIILQPSKPGGRRFPGRSEPPVPGTETPVPEQTAASRAETLRPLPPGERVEAVNEPAEAAAKVVKTAGPAGMDSGEAAPSDEDTFSGAPAVEAASPSDEDELLMETIILSPKKGPESPEKKN